MRTFSYLNNETVVNTIVPITNNAMRLSSVRERTNLFFLSAISLKVSKVSIIVTGQVVVFMGRPKRLNKISAPMSMITPYQGASQNVYCFHCEGVKYNDKPPPTRNNTKIIRTGTMNIAIIYAFLTYLQDYSCSNRTDRQTDHHHFYKRDKNGSILFFNPCNNRG